MVERCARASDIARMMPKAARRSRVEVTRARAEPRRALRGPACGLHGYTPRVSASDPVPSPALETLDLTALRRVFDAAFDHMGDRDRPVVVHTDPVDLAARFAEAAGGLPLGEGAHSLDQLRAALELTVELSVHTDHPGFVNQNFAGADPVAVLADALGAVLNTTSATYEAAPVFTLMEREVLATLAAQIGWPRPALDAPDPAGLFFPGGSASNLAAMQLARVRADPELLERGSRGGPDLVALTSKRAHYSIDKAARLLGLGRRGVVSVDCDEGGAMRPDALAESLVRLRAAGRRPFFINLTAGTTVQGAFDPVAEIVAMLASKPSETRPWLHVDGAVGAAVLFSRRERHRLAGVEAVDSVTWNLHKLSGVTQQCSALLVRQPRELRTTFSTRADYLFQADKKHAGLDLGDLGFGCARRNDALKAWFTIAARGIAALGRRVEHGVDLASRFEQRVLEDPRFALVCPRSFGHVCFWWLPPDLRGRSLGPEDHARLHALAPRIKARMQDEGQALIGYQPVNDGPNGWRMLFINPAVTWADAEAILERLDRLGRNLD